MGRTSRDGNHRTHHHQEARWRAQLHAPRRPEADGRRDGHRRRRPHEEGPHVEAIKAAQAGGKSDAGQKDAKKDGGQKNAAKKDQTKKDDAKKDEATAEVRKDTDAGTVSPKREDAPGSESRDADRRGDAPKQDRDDRDGNRDGARDGQGAQGEGRNRNRRRRGRDRNRPGSGGQRNEPDTTVLEDDVLVPAAGILDVLDNYAFVRTSGYLAGPEDVYLSLSMVRKFGLRRGDAIVGQVRQPREGERKEKFNPMVRIDSVNGADPEQAKTRVDFSKLTPLYPSERLRLETEPTKLIGRVIGSMPRSARATRLDRLPVRPARR